MKTVRMVNFDLYVHHKLYTLAEKAQDSKWIIDVIPCGDGVPLLWIRKRCGLVIEK